ncbi:MAG: hypothetical protein ACKO04_06000 [Actinomycetes bacterium]
MSSRRWFNNRLPQTLAIAQFLLYFNAFWAAIGILAVTRNGALVTLIIGLTLAANLYGGWGIANEMKRGYQVAVLAAFLPLLGRVVAMVLTGRGLGYVLIGGNVINALFEYALIALLLHPMSRGHQKIWFT